MLDSKQLAWPAYVVSAAMILVPLADVGTSMYPWRVIDPRWRFGAVGIVSNALLIPLAGVLLAYLTASALQHHRARRAIGIFTLVASVFCLAAVVLFGLDALQTRAAVRPELRASFGVAAVAAGMKTLVAMTACIVIAVAALRRGPRPAGVRDRMPVISVAK